MQDVADVEKIKTEIVVHLSESHQQMARILDAKRQATVRMSELVHGLPDVHPQLGGLEGILESSSMVTKSIIAYLNSLGSRRHAGGIASCGYRYEMAQAEAGKAGKAGSAMAEGRRVSDREFGCRRLIGVDS